MRLLQVEGVVGLMAEVSITAEGFMVEDFQGEDFMAFQEENLTSVISSMITVS